MARSVIDAVIDLIVVVPLKPPTTVPPICKLVPIAKMTEVSIKIMVEVAEEENRREAHVKR
jgi:hypothetical protein